MNFVSPLSDQSYGSYGDLPVFPNGLSDLSSITFTLSSGHTLLQYRRSDLC